MITIYKCKKCHFIIEIENTKQLKKDLKEYKAIVKLFGCKKCLKDINKLIKNA